MIKKKATALILALATMIIVGIGAVAILQVMASYSQMGIVSIGRIKAQYLAEAGMQYAIWQCRNGDLSSPTTLTTEKWPITIIRELQSDGSYKITVTVQYAGL
ncbi:MAG: hypothetical protein NC828_04205 [Candidatus Omnitrophica bacterium]|nr:hypothetical protein [Candidatus Omnitrophota bacterium]